MLLPLKLPGFGAQPLSRSKRKQAHLKKMNEMKYIPYKKGCAKDIISPMGCINSHVRKGWWLRGGHVAAPIYYELSIT